MNGRTNLQETTAPLLTKIKVKEELQMDRGAVDDLDNVGLRLSPEYIISYHIIKYRGFRLQLNVYRHHNFKLIHQITLQFTLLYELTNHVINYYYVVGRRQAAAQILDVFS